MQAEASRGASRNEQAEGLERGADPFGYVGVASIFAAGLAGEATPRKHLGDEVLLGREVGVRRGGNAGASRQRRTVRSSKPSSSTSASAASQSRATVSAWRAVSPVGSALLSAVRAASSGRRLRDRIGGDTTDLDMCPEEYRSTRHVSSYTSDRPARSAEEELRHKHCSQMGCTSNSTRWPPMIASRSTTRKRVTNSASNGARS